MATAIVFPKPNALERALSSNSPRTKVNLALGTLQKDGANAFTPFMQRMMADQLSSWLVALVFVNVEAKRLIRDFDGEYLWYFDSQRMFLVSNGLWF
ncbi:hypothetical protein OSJ77_02680 [Phyllobacterium sp. 0TCS1.6C]|uniref:hypothetical protein n=1 Tax=unclassified Phyllobacterium TaxID=2638441 RepID=UPI002263FD15|nr:MULTISPECIES: hypothetical protein [unclassified Phyllobacterium]MCX8279090.1 hypothetical protein [Phyllobacterium sp. 0TCS1.6C]MCX8293874.1 hypothetical protein [Phyllobacterium sp. 0TCS1.6A]